MTPEHLFAAGYAACFGGAVDYVAKLHKLDASKAKIDCSVSIGQREGGGFALAVKMHVEDKSIPTEELKNWFKKRMRKFALILMPLVIMLK